MKVKLYSYFLVISNITTNVTSEIITKEPYAVTPTFEGLEDLYLQLRNPNPRPAESRLTPTLKWQICKNIFVKPENILPTISKYEILLNPVRLQSWFQDNRKDIYDDLFQRVSQTPSYMCMPGSTRRDHCYVNRSRLLPINVRGVDYQENVFECQVIDREQYEDVGRVNIDEIGSEPYSWPRSELQIRDDMKRIKRYFVSDSDYDVNEAPGGDYISGRFVFYYDEEMKLLVLHALAEESSPIVRTKKKAHYLKRREGYLPALDELDDPICRLDRGRKLRVCNSVLLEERRKFGSTVRLVDERCERRFFSLKGESEEVKYSEWLMKCGFYGTGNAYTYVSRGYSHNEVFIHSTRGVNKTLKLYGYQQKIAVVRDIRTAAESGGAGGRVVQEGESSSAPILPNTDGQN